ncbi:MAG: linear amide C-N hydrolase [Endomicrobiaceae bacterium]|nr:linear amide C-N hydrolase [Endomicrobiaceae bacterium]
MHHRFRKFFSFFCLISFLAGVFFFLADGVVLACSRVLSANNGQAVLVGRNMDWPENVDSALWFLPRGIQRKGLTDGNSLIWSAKYSSIVTASSVKGKSFASDGINEKGLEANLLWLDESDYGKRDELRPGLSIALWAQYILDNYSTVEEAVQAIKLGEYQIVDVNIPMFIPTVGTTMSRASLHLALADKTGDSAIIEYINGKPVIYHDRNYVIMTNSPTFDKQQENLKQYSGFGGEKPLPGTSQATDRFVRASFYLKNLPQPHNLREAIAHMLSVTRNVSQPFIVSLDPKHPYTAATIWRTVGDLTNGYYYYESTISPYLVWADFTEFNSAVGAPAMKLDLSKNPDYNGNVSKLFKKADPTELKAPKFD